MHVVLLVNMFLLQFWTTPGLIFANYLGLGADGAICGFVFDAWGSPCCWARCCSWGCSGS